MTSRIENAYRAIEVVAGPKFLEPLSDVQRVNELRQHFKPAKVKLLIVGESHIRRPLGPGFIYDSSYYTPWWRDLLWPAFGGSELSRADSLKHLQDRGVWILDASIIALSGYRNIAPEWPSRPLDAHLKNILAASWDNFVGREFQASTPEHVVYFERAADMLPEGTRKNGTALRFNGPRHSKALRYTAPEYRFGTARFIQAVRAAGL